MSDVSNVDAKNAFAEFPVVEGEVDEGEDKFAEFPLAEPTIGEKIVAFGQGATGAALETAPILGGMVMGAKLGALGGPAAPITVPLGAAAGAGAGFLFGKEARRQASKIPLPSGETGLTTPSVKDQRTELRPFGLAGEVFGGSAPFAAVPLAAARVGASLPPSTVGNFLNRIVDMAAKSPGTTSAVELGATTFSAIAGATSETFAPGETGIRTAAEIAGGFFNPSRIIIGATKGSMDVAKAAIETLSVAGRETRAAKVLIDIVEESGGDPEVLAKLLNASGLPGVNPTAAQKTGDPALIALESKLSQRSDKFASEVAGRAAESLLSIKNMIVALRGTGDPQALAAAADLRGRYFRLLLSGRVQAAEAEVANAVAGITQDSPRVISELSRRSLAIMEEALKEARLAESQLWGKIPRDIPAEASNVTEAHAALRAQMLPEEAIPDVVEGFVARVTKALEDGDVPTDSGELLRLRSRMLALARESAAKGDSNDARIFGTMAEAALDDLTAIGARAGGALDEARTFSRELHDTFTRTFAGKAASTERTGAQRIPPETIMRRAFGTGKEAGELRLREIEDATRFLTARDLGSPEAAQNIEVMLDAQDRLLRLAAAETVNANTGRVSATRLSKFIKDNELLMDRFPEVRADLQRALKAENGLVDVTRLNTGATRVIDQQAAFSKISKIENPVDAVAAALNGKAPVKDLLGMVKVAKRGGPEAEAGLKAAVFDHVVRKSGDNFSNLRASLFDPIRPGQPSVADLMQRAGIMTQQDIKQTKKLLSAADKIVEALESGAKFDELTGSPDALFDLVLRVAGARAGAQGAAGAAAGSSLVAAGAGSRFLRNMFDKVPKARVSSVLIEAAKNPRFAAMLLQSAPGQREKITLTRQIHAYLLQAGLLESEEPTSPGEVSVEN